MAFIDFKYGTGTAEEMRVRNAKAGLKATPCPKHLKNPVWDTEFGMWREGPDPCPPPKEGINPKDQAAQGKPGLRFIPLGPVFAAGVVMALGASKYGAYNWRNVKIRASVYYDAMHRHLHRWWEGEDIDTESGQHHLAHVLANCCLVLDAERQEIGIADDRPKVAVGPEF